MQQSNAISAGLPPEQRECEALQGHGIWSRVHAVARGQQPRGVARRVDQPTSVALRGRPWRGASANKPSSSRFARHVFHECMKMHTAEKAPASTQSSGKSRAPFSESDEVLNEGLPWQQVCKDVSALPSLAPDNNFRQRWNLFSPSSAEC